MIHYLNRFSMKLAEYTATLRELTKKHVTFRWELHNQTALDKILKELSSSRIISYYDPIQHLQLYSVMPVKLDLEHG